MQEPDSTSAILNSEKKRLVDVLTLIENVCKQEDLILTVEEHRGFVGWESSLCSLPGISFNSEVEGEPIWMTVKRLAQKTSPACSVILEPWLISSNDPDREPTLRSQITIQVKWENSKRRAEKVAAGENVSAEVTGFDLDTQVDENRLIFEHPKIEEEYLKYKTELWIPWADSERPRRATIKIYSSLFELMRKLELENSADRTEIVWGMGVVTGPLLEKQIRYPIVTATVYITIDESSNSLWVRPSQTSLPVLESTSYEKLEVAGVKEVIARFKEWLEKDRIPLSPFHPETFFDVTRTAAAQLSDRGIYWPDVNPDQNDRSIPKKHAELIVTDTWVLFSRKKSTHFFVEDVRQLKNDVQNQAELPGGARAIVTDPTDERKSEPRRNYRGVWGVISSSFGSQTTSPAKPEELYFPKAYNSEQLDIIDRLNAADGVVVQGPPGTGKTHTIANVICHYLAHGKRVLVTSSGEAALKVLRDKLPDGIKELVVTRLQNDREGTQQVERSIKHIASEVASASLEKLRFDIEGTEARIERLHQELESYSAQMRVWAQSQTSVVPSDPERRTPIEIAQLVFSQKSRFDWFPDTLGIESRFNPLFTSEDLNSVRDARFRLGSDIQYLNESLPSAGDLPTVSMVVALHEDFKKLAMLSEKSLVAGVYRFSNFEQSTIAVAERILRDVDVRLELLSRLGQGTLSKRLLIEIRDRYEGVVTQELLKIRSKVIETEEQRLGRLTSRVEIPGDLENSSFIKTIISKFASGENPGGWFKQTFSQAYRGALVKIQQIRINTEVVSTRDGWVRVQQELEGYDQVKELTVRWNNIAREVELPEVSGFRFEGLKALLRESAVLEDVSKFCPSHDANLRSMVREAFSDLSESEFDICEEKGLRKLQESLNLGLPHQRYKFFEQRREDILDKFTKASGVVAEQAVHLLTKTLGRVDVDGSDIDQQWANILELIRKRDAQKPLFDEVKRVSGIFQECGAPIFAERLRSQPVVQDYDELLPAHLPEAWQLQRFASYIATIDCHDRLQKLMTDRETAERHLTRAYEELVRSRTWLELNAKLSPRLNSSLNAFMSAIKSLGKGTGVRAERHRAEARTALSEAWEAIPCWIMSTVRVSESLPSKLGLFDLVIIDEASQSYIEALPALIRGKKVLVVGDDEQISPTSFVSEADVSRYKDKYLRDLPKNFQAQLSPGKSLYDFARVVFPSGQVTLREHFRCVSAIIEFSNLLCYDGRIQCLRVPKLSERLDPPLIDVYVKGAYRADKTNKAEADAIVREIVRISQTSGMENRSIGVISLLGNEQAKLINDELMKRLGEVLIRRHDIVCGDAYTLQGNERDIVFLSMIVTAEDARSETSRPFKQRFNVAASRARDRMYLFRSVRREDLKDGDLKARLLDHFRAPLPNEEPSVSQLRDKCESSFELAVFDELVSRGYSVSPQVRSSGYRIDMVVEGDNDARLAIECDGDQYHGPEQWAEDYKRQRILERAGWKFWRCWGSSFYRDQNGCFEDLFAKLEELGIKPKEGVLETALSRFVEYREVSPFDLVTQENCDGAQDGLVQEKDAQSAEIPIEKTDHIAVNELSPKREIGRVDLDELVEYFYEDEPTRVYSLRVVELGVTNVSQGIVAAKSALGSVLLGSRVGDTFQVDLAGAARLARIMTIHDIDDPDLGCPPFHQDAPSSDSVLAESPHGEITLHPYTPWRSRSLPDPRKVRPAEVFEALEEIVYTEGPISCERAFALYSKAAGLQRLGADIKDALFRGLQSGIVKGQIRSVNELRKKDRLKNILSIAGRSHQLPRESGGREFSEIPPSELVLLLEAVIHAKGGGGDRNTIHREVVRIMGGSRLAVSAREHLARVEELLVESKNA